MLARVAPCPFASVLRSASVATTRRSIAARYGFRSFWFGLEVPRVSTPLSAHYEARHGSPRRNQRRLLGQEAVKAEQTINRPYSRFNV